VEVDFTQPLVHRCRGGQLRELRPNALRETGMI
jgi:hypothetical protein